MFSLWCRALIKKSTRVSLAMPEKGLQRKEKMKRCRRNPNLNFSHGPMVRFSSRFSSTRIFAKRRLWRKAPLN